MRNPAGFARTVIICSATLLLAIQAVLSIAAPIAPGPTVPIVKGHITSTAPNPNIAVNKVLLVKPINSQPIIVTADYIRMHQPELIVGLTSQIKSGHMSVSALSPLVGSDILNRLLESNMTPLLSRISSSTQNAQVNKAAASALNSVIDYNSVTQSNPTPLLTLPGSEYSPHDIDDNPLRQNQREYIKIKFTNPLSDSITASLSDGQNGHIQINWLRSYTGQWQPTPEPNGPLQPIISSQTSPGSALGANAGQDCAVEIELNFPNIGQYHSSLTVTGNSQAPWSFTVPIKADVTEMGTSGASASVDQSDLMMASNEIVDLPITITPTNYHSPFTAKISAMTLPNGVSMLNFSVNISSRSDVHTKIRLLASNVQMEVDNAPVKFTLDPGDGTKTEFHSSISIEPYWVQWQFPTNNLMDGWGNACESWNNPTVDLADSGNWYLSGGFWASGDQISGNNGAATFGFFFSTSAITGIGETSWVNLSPIQLGPLAGSSQRLRQNWNSYIHQTPAAWLSSGIQNTAPWNLATSPAVTIEPL